MDLEKDWLRRITVGALRDAINAHGPITPNLIGSAAKRIAGRIYGEVKIRGTNGQSRNYRRQTV